MQGLLHCSVHESQVGRLTRGCQLVGCLTSRVPRLAEELQGVLVCAFDSGPIILLQCCHAHIFGPLLTPVSRSSSSKKWQAGVNLKGKNLQIGTYDEEEEAARAFDRVALRVRGLEAKRINL